MDDKNINFYERRLLREIEDVESKIRDLQVERASLQRLLASARGREKMLPFVRRKNSFDRVVVETAVLDALRNSHKPMRSADLYRQALASTHGLKESTFRSHLHRLKQREQIENPRGVRGLWQLVASDG
jgi:hypothetical protein